MERCIQTHDVSCPIFMLMNASYLRRRLFRERKLLCCRDESLIPTLGHLRVVRRPYTDPFRFLLR